MASRSHSPWGIWPRDHQRVVRFVFLLQQISARSLARSLRTTFPAADAYAYFYLVRSVSSLLVYLSTSTRQTRETKKKIFLKLLSLPINLLSAMTLSLALHRAKTRSWTWTWMVTKRGKSPLLGSAVAGAQCSYCRWCWPAYHDSNKPRPAQKDSWRCWDCWMLQPGLSGQGCSLLRLKFGWGFRSFEFSSIECTWFLNQLKSFIFFDALIRVGLYGVLVKNI